MLTLTRDDWQEIAASICHQRQALEDGRCGSCIEHDEENGACHCTQEWADQLASILAVIGEEGELAVAYGVAPCACA